LLKPTKLIKFQKMSSLLDHLKKVKVNDILRLRERALVYADSNMTIQECSELLAKNNILSVPIWNKEQNRFIGIVDTFDILRFIVFGKTYLELPKEGLYKTLENFRVSEYASMRVEELVQLFDRPKHLNIMDPKDSLTKLMQVFSTSAAHRALMIAPDPRIVCQTDVVKYLYMKSIGDAILKQTLCDLGLDKDQSVVTAKKADRALDAFRKMHLKEVHAVAVVDENGKLFGTLSSSDLRGIPADQLLKVMTPTAEFINSTPQNVICVASDTLGNVMKKVMDHQVHRVWMINDKQEPIGVVSLGDIIRCFLPVPA